MSEELQDDLGTVTKTCCGDVRRRNNKLYHFPQDIASPVAVDLGSYRAGHTAETAQFLVVSGVTCGLQCLLHQHGGDIRGETDLAPGLKDEGGG